MAAKTLIGLILFALGFVILLMFFTTFSWDSETNRQVCHQSIIWRATLSESDVLSSDLNCQTEKICIGKECSDFKNAEDISYEKPDSVLELEAFLAEEIVACWSMTGEGKLSIFNPSLATRLGVSNNIYSSCILCSRIAFDSDYLSDKGIDLNELDLAGYMQSTKVPGKEYTFAQTLQGESNVKLDVGDTDFELEGEKLSEYFDFGTGDEGFSSIDNPELAIVFSQISATEGLEVAKNLLSIAGGSYFIGGGKIIRKTVTSVYGLAALAVFGGYVAYTVNENMGFVSSYCGSLTSSDDGRRGCSVVRTINYDADSISTYCTAVESNF